MVMENGSLLTIAPPKKAISVLRDHPSLLDGMPAAVRLFAAMHGKGEAPLDIKEGRAFLEKNYGNDIRVIPENEYIHREEKALEFRNVCFRYEKNGKDILSDLDFDVYENEIFCILGGNGAGKTTTLSAAAGLLTPYSGSIRVFGKRTKDYKNGSLYKACLSFLPQDVQTVFLRNTVREELDDAGADISSLPYDLSHLLHKHPYDISGGERQLTALAKVLATNPRLLLLDEPTKGLDAHAKARVIEALKTLKEKGVTLVIVTHDVEFAASLADRIALFFRGSIICAETPKAFFAENNFYTTAISRMTRGYYDRAVTLEDAVTLCTENGGKA
jgi:energy-coupling factor transport system ATP-binding protein